MTFSGLGVPARVEIPLQSRQFEIVSYMGARVFSYMGASYWSKFWTSMTSPGLGIPARVGIPVQSRQFAILSYMGWGECLILHGGESYPIWRWAILEQIYDLIEEMRVNIGAHNAQLSLKRFLFWSNFFTQWSKSDIHPMQWGALKIKLSLQIWNFVVYWSVCVVHWLEAGG